MNITGWIILVFVAPWIIAINMALFLLIKVLFKTIKEMEDE